MFATGDGLLKQEDGTTSDGLAQIFATNLFGHFVLVQIKIWLYFARTTEISFLEPDLLDWSNEPVLNEDLQ